MDSLDLTIDSVARNFGSNNPANATTTSQTLEPSPNTTQTTLTQSNQPSTANNRSILSISQSSPLSVTAISSPTSMHLLSPSQLNSPGGTKKTLKRQKSSSGALTNRSLSNLAGGSMADQAPPSVPPPSVSQQPGSNKRKKTLDSSSSDVSLNSPAINKSSGKALAAAAAGGGLSSANEAGGVDQQRKAGTKSVASGAVAGPADGGVIAKKVRLNVHHSTLKTRARMRQLRRQMSIQRKERVLMRQAQFFSVQKLIDTPYVNGHANKSVGLLNASRRKSPSQTSFCCKYKYNMYKDLNNQVIHESFHF